MDQREGHNFMACGQAHGLKFGSEGDGQGLADLGLQWIQEKNTISWYAAKHMDQILGFMV